MAASNMSDFQPGTHFQPVLNDSKVQAADKVDTVRHLEIKPFNSKF
jgi:hypothetical protein